MDQILLELREGQKEAQPNASRRAIANRQNALKSTGPRTQEGKQASRRNAVKHGLAGKGVVLPGDIEDDARERRAAWKEAVNPHDQLAVELVDLGATSMSQLRQCWRQTASTRSEMIDRADQMWEYDRRAEITDLTNQLSKDPESVSARLLISAAGTVWMIERWQALGRRLELGQEWSEKYRSLALDLLGVPELFRDEFTPVDLPGAPDPEALRSHRLAVVGQELERLAEHLETRLLPLEEDRRELMRSNLLISDDPGILLLMRYERQLSNRVLGTVRQLRGDKARADQARSRSTSAQGLGSSASSASAPSAFVEREDVFAKAERERERATWDKSPEQVAAEAQAAELVQCGKESIGSLFSEYGTVRLTRETANIAANQTKPTSEAVATVAPAGESGRSPRGDAEYPSERREPGIKNRKSAG